MKLNEFKKLKAKSDKRVGRGPGSGKGKTSGRGTKGQNARNRISITHPHQEGGQRPLFKRLPYRRGKGNHTFGKRPIAINLEALSKLPKGSVVDIKTLVENNIITKNDGQKFSVKILGVGEVTQALTVALPTSKSAAAKIEKAGGKIELVEKSAKISRPKVTKPKTETKKETK